MACIPQVRLSLGRAGGASTRYPIIKSPEDQVTTFLHACEPLLGSSIPEPEITSAALPPEFGKPSDRFKGIPVDNDLAAGIEAPNWFSTLLPQKKSAVVQACLRALNNRTSDPREDWLRVLFAVADAERLGCPGARQLALEWSRCGASWMNESEFDTAWGSFNAKPGGVTIGTLLGMAREAGLDLSQWRPGGLAPLNAGQEPARAIYYYPGNESECRDALDGAVAEDAHTFTMGDKLVILRVPDQQVSEFENWSGDLPGTTAALPADIVERAEALTWMGPAGGKGGQRYKQIHPPRALCADYITQRRGRYRARPLLGVSRVPFMSDDGNLRSEVGYDPQTRIFYDRLPNLTIPASPARSDAEHALQRLLKPFEHYTFEDPKTGPLLVFASLLPALERPFMNTAPMFVVKGAQAGTGKGQMVRAVGHLALGTPPPFMAWGHDDDEFKKRLDAMLFASPAMLVIDNCNGRQLQGDTLEMILSEGTATIRPLGKSEAVTVRNRTFFMANGNNIGISGDMSRRAFVTKILPRSASPERDRFPFTPEEYVVGNRDALLSDAYMIMRAYRRNGMPRCGLPAVGSFPEWERKVRDLAYWLTGYDLSEEFDKNKQDDPHRQNDAALLAALRSYFEQKWFKASDVEAALRRAADRRRFGLAGVTVVTTTTAQTTQAQEHAMLEAAEQVFGSRPVNAKTLGYWAKAIENAIVDGFVLRRQMDQHSKSNLIAVEIR